MRAYFILMLALIHWRF